MEVIVSLDDKSLRRYLNNRSVKCDYIYLGERKTDVTQLLSERSFDEITISKYDNSSRDRLLRECVDLVGKLGQKYNSIYWWATYTASKNRFASKLPLNLFLFYSLTDVIKQGVGNDIIIINPPEVICGPLKTYCSANSIGFRLLQDPIKKAIETPKRIGRDFLGKIHFVYQTWKRIYKANRYFGKEFARSTDKYQKCFVLKSWVYNGSIDPNKEYRDPFFGKLPSHLFKRGRNVLIVASIAERYETVLNKMLNDDQYGIIPQELFLSYLDPIRAIIDVQRNRIKISGQIKFEGMDVFNIVKESVDADFRGGSILMHYVYYYWVRRLLNAIQVESFALTYENNPWEKMCVLALDQYSPETRVLGYQHNVVPQASLNMFVSEYEKDVIPIPDKILTVGAASKRIMEQYGVYEEGKLEESCALRYEYLFDIQPEPRRRTNQILIALEGVFDVHCLVNYVLGEAGKLSEYTIKIRSHPGLPFDRITHLVDFDIDSFDHVLLSQNTSLEKDIRESDIVIYWGSTVGLEALSMGKPIIHFDSESILSYDPLFECNHLKWIVNRNTDLSEVISGIYSLSDEEYDLQLRGAKEYLGDYFYDVNEERLDTFIR